MFAELRKKEQVLTYTLGDTLVDHVDLFFETTGLDASRRGEILLLFNALKRDEIALEDLSPLIKEAFGLTVERANKVAEQFIGYLVLPFTLYLPSLPNYLKETKISDYPVYRIPFEQVSLEEAIDTILGVNKDIFPAHLKQRFTLIIFQYLKGERDAAKTIDMLGRDITIGGLGLAPNVAGNIIKAVDEYTESGVRVEGVVYPESSASSPTKSAKDANSTMNVSKPAPDSSPVAAPAVIIKPAQAEPEEASKPSIALKPSSSATPSTVDEDESLVIREPFNIEEHVEQLQEIKELPPFDPVAKPAPAPAAVAKTPGSAATQRSVARVVQETHALAASVPVINGEFMTEEERAEVDQHKVPAEQVKKDMAEEELEMSKEGEQLTEQLWARVKGSAVTKKALGQLVETTLRGIRNTIQFENHLKEDFKLEAALAGDMTATIEAVLQSRHEAYRKKHLARMKAIQEAEEKTKQTSKIKEEAKENPQPPAEPLKPAKIEVSTPSVHKALHGAQKVTDIVYQKQTLGPVDELAFMEPSDLRLLASRTQDIPDVLLAKIDTIAEIGYEERLKAVQAWQRSPVNLLYVRLLRDSMAQLKPLPEIIAAERAKGHEVLSPAEIDAIMAINKRLRV